MRGISLYQPWASLMAIGAKQNETRPGRILYRGDLVICAAKKMETISLDLSDLLWEHRTQIDETLLTEFPTKMMEHLPFGHALCVVEVYDCIPTLDVFGCPPKHPITETEQALGNYTPGRYAWLTRNVRRFKKPFPFKGHQGFMNVPDELVKEALK